MGKLLKILLSTVAGLALLIIVAVIVAPFIVDPNDFKPQIQSAVQQNTGRELAIKGDLSLSVFPWIGVSTGKLVLSNAQGFGDKPFAVIEETDIKVKLVPLFSRQIEVSRVVLKGLELNLAKNKQGVTNWDDLIEKPAKEAEKAPAPSDDPGSKKATPAFAALAIGGVSIEEASIVWDDYAAAQHVEIKNFNLQTDPLAFEQPVAVELSMTVLNKAPEVTAHIGLTTDVVINQAMNVINLKNLRLDNHAIGEAVPGGEMKASFNSDMALDLPRQTLALTGMKLATGDLELTAEIQGQQIIDKPVFSGPVAVAEFNLAKFLQSMAIKLPVMQDSAALNKLAASFNITATPQSAVLNGLSVRLDDSNLTGTVNVKNFATSALAFKLALDAIDVDRYLAPQAQNQKTSAPVASPAAAAAAGATLLPVDTLRGLNVDGDLSVGTLKVSNLKMQGIVLKLDAANGLIRTTQAVKQFYQGGYNGSSSINVKGKQPAISLNEKLSGVQIEPLLKDLKSGGDVKMSGVVSANARLDTSGNSTQAIKSALNGALDFQFKDSVIRGFNLQKMIDNTKALIDGAPLPAENKNDQTMFSEISGTATITNGLLRNDDLKALSSRFVMDGAGTAHLATEKLDYKVTAKVIKKATDQRPEQIKGVPLVIKIGGTFSKPGYTLDIPAMLLEKNKEKIEQKKQELLKKLDEKVGPGVGEMLDKQLGPKATDLLKKFF